MAQIGDAIGSPFTAGQGTIGCFLKGAFFGINDCVVALTAAHVLFSHESDFSASAMSRGKSMVDSETSPTTLSPQARNTNTADEFLAKQGTFFNRDDVSRWALGNEPFKQSADHVFQNGVPDKSDNRVLFKPALAPPYFWIPYTKRDLSETDWGLAIVTKRASHDNTVKAVPASAKGNWSGWVAPKKGDQVFKYGQTTKLTEGTVSLEPDQKQFTVKGSKGQFSGEGDSGGGVFSIDSEGLYSLIGIISKGGAAGSTILRMDYIVSEIRALYGVAAEKA